MDWNAILTTIAPTTGGFGLLLGLLWLGARWTRENRADDRADKLEARQEIAQAEARADVADERAKRIQDAADDRARIFQEALDAALKRARDSEEREATLAREVAALREEVAKLRGEVAGLRADVSGDHGVAEAG